MRAIILGCVLALSAAVAQAAVYKWVDQNGKTHYSDKPVQNAEKLKVPGAKKAEPGQADADQDEPKSDETAAAEVRSQKCAQASKRLTDYQNASGLREKDEFGKERALSPEEQVQAIVEMQRNVDSFCADQPERAEQAEEELQTETVADTP